jgi:hypothetical protein
MCFYCGTAITNRDDLCGVSTYPHEFAPRVNAEPGEYFACPKCYAKKDKAAQAKFERRFPPPRKAVPILTLLIKLKVTATPSKPIKHVDLGLGSSKGHRYFAYFGKLDDKV